VGGALPTEKKARHDGGLERTPGITVQCQRGRLAERGSTHPGASTAIPALHGVLEPQIPEPAFCPFVPTGGEEGKLTGYARIGYAS